jgi:hypothetical protein
MNPARPSEIFKKALSLEPGKQIVLTFTDRKKFLSVRTGLHTTKRSLENKTVEIRSQNENTITLQLHEEEQSVQFSIEDIPEEITIVNSSYQKTKDKNNEAIEKLNLLLEEKDFYLQELQKVFSLLGPEGIAKNRNDPESELYSLETSFNKVQHKIREHRKAFNIPPERTPTDEKENELDLIEN